jgi:hypothetical protein
MQWPAGHAHANRGFQSRLQRSPLLQSVDVRQTGARAAQKFGERVAFAARGVQTGSDEQSKNVSSVSHEFRKRIFMQPFPPNELKHRE